MSTPRNGSDHSSTTGSAGFPSIPSRFAIHGRASWICASQYSHPNNNDNEIRDFCLVSGLCRVTQVI